MGTFKTLPGIQLSVQYTDCPSTAMPDGLSRPAARVTVGPPVSGTASTAPLAANGCPTSSQYTFLASTARLPGCIRPDASVTMQRPARQRAVEGGIVVHVAAQEVASASGPPESRSEESSTAPSEEASGIEACPSAGTVTSGGPES